MRSSASDQTPPDIEAVLAFLPCRTPDAWVSRAVAEIPTLLQDHASLELKAAQQAQKLIRTYAHPSRDRSTAEGSRFDLLTTMSRLAREELRHFERVIAILRDRSIAYRSIPASRYAAALHTHVGRREPDRLVDTLIVGAIIEARSCERFHCLGSKLGSTEPGLARFYGSLVKSEARHFLDYLGLAETVAGTSIAARTAYFLGQERALILGPDPEIRLHSGMPDERTSVIRVTGRAHG